MKIQTREIFQKKYYKSLGKNTSSNFIIIQIQDKEQSALYWMKYLTKRTPRPKSKINHQVKILSNTFCILHYRTLFLFYLFNFLFNRFRNNTANTCGFPDNRCIRVLSADNINPSLYTAAATTINRDLGRNQILNPHHHCSATIAPTRIRNQKSTATTRQFR